MFLLGSYLSKISYPVGKGPGKSSSHNISNIIKRRARSDHGQAKCKSCLPKGQAGMQVFFFKPCSLTCPFYKEV